MKSQEVIPAVSTLCIKYSWLCLKLFATILLRNLGPTFNVFRLWASLSQVLNVKLINYLQTFKLTKNSTR